MTFLKYWESKETKVVVISLGNGDVLLESLREVMTGIGSLTRGTIHWVSSNDMPPDN